MAYVEQYYTTWRDSESKEHKIKLLQDGGGSGSTALEIQTLTPYEYFFSGDRKSQINDQIFGREILFNFLVTSSEISAIDAMVKSNYKEWKIEHYLESTLDGVFWLQPENYSRNYIKNGDYYEIQLSGVDGLANIRNIEFKKFSDGSQYEDRAIIISTIKRALEHIGFALDFRVQLGTWCTNDSLMNADACTLKEVNNDSRRFVKEKDGRLINTNCYKVISELLEPLNCYLIQSEGFYWIINTREDDSYYFPIAWSDLAISARVSSDLKVAIDSYKYKSLGDAQTIRPLEIVGVTFRDRNVRDNSLNNGDFHLPNTNEWVNGNLTVLSVNPYGDNYEMRAVYAVLLDGAPAEIPNFHSIAQAIVVRGEADQIQVQVKMRCHNLTMDGGWSGESYNERIKVSCRIRKGTFDGDIITSGVDDVLLGSFDNIHRQYIYYFDIVEDDDYFVEFLIDKMIDNVWTNYEAFSIAFDDINVIAAYSTGEDLTFDSYKKISNADSEYIDSIDIDLQFGDSESDTDIGAFKVGNTRTETWSRFGKSENQSINKLAGLNLIENFAQYKEYLHLEIYDETDSIFPHSIIQIGSKHYQQVNQYVSYPVKKQKIIDVELIEILKDSVNVTIEDFGLSSIDGDTSSSDPGGAVSNPSGNPSQTPYVGNLQKVTDTGNLTTKNIGITSDDASYFTGDGGLAIGKTSVGDGLILDILGNVKVTGTLNATSNLQEGGTNISAKYEAVLGNPGTNGYILSSTTGGSRSWVSNEASQWITNGSNIYYNAGKVSIGTDNPLGTFHIIKDQDSGLTEIRISNTHSGNNASSSSVLLSLGNNLIVTSYGENHLTRSNENWIYSTSGSGKLVFGTNSIARMTIDGSEVNFNVSKVGFGTDNSQTLVSLAKDNVIGVATTNGSDDGYIVLSAAGADNSNRGARISLSGVNRATHGGKLELHAGTSGAGNEIQFYIGNDLKVVIDNNGKTGFNEPNPDEIIHVQGNIKIEDTILSTNPVTLGGTVGSLVIDAGITGGYEGYSIGGRAAFIHDNANITGIYDDVNQKWLFKATHGAASELYYNGSRKLETTNTGVTITGNVKIDDTTLYSDPSDLGMSRGSLVINGGATGGWSGYGIGGGGGVSFIFDDDFQLGIFDDANDSWIIFAEVGGQVELNYGGVKKFETLASGARVEGLLMVTENIKAFGQITVLGKIVTFSTTPTFDLDDGNVQEMILTDHVTSLTLSNKLNAGNYLIYLIQDSTGGYTIPTPDATWGTATDNSVNPSNFLTGPNDRNLINVAVSPSGFTEYSIETHDI